MFTDLITIFGWFLTGKKPTQAQFEATFKSFWHKGEKIPISAVDNLEQTLNGKAEEGSLNIHLSDPHAHKDEFAKVFSPYRFITVFPIVAQEELQIETLIGADFDMMAAQNQIITDGLFLDPDTGTLTGWSFEPGVKYIIFYTKTETNEN